MAPELALGGLQHWLQAVIEAPGPVKRALRSPEAARLVRPRDACRLVRPSARGLRPAERVGIYQGMYLPRMMEALESDYPGLAHFLGPAAWRRLVRRYVTRHPSRSYTLNELGRKLPDFVGRSRLQRAAFCRDLAQLERAVSDVFDERETPPLAEAAFARLRPHQLARARLVPVAALRLVSLRHDASAYFDSLKGDQHQHPPVRRVRQRVVVYRRDYTVMRRVQPEAAFALLSDLVEGMPVGRALERALRRRGAAKLAGADAAFRLFREWAAMGIFRAVETGARIAGRRRVREAHPGSQRGIGIAARATSSIE